MLPTTSADANVAVNRSYADRYAIYVTAAQRNATYGHYLRRAFRWKQMDVEYALWQFVTMCVNPKAVYRHTTYRKQTKNQWARDDPTFAVMLAVFVGAAACAWCAAYDDGPPGHSLRVLARSVLGDYLAIACVSATIGWHVANAHLRARTRGERAHAVEQRVEWLYALDVHCNAFAPTFVLLYVAQGALSPFLASPGVLQSCASCALYAVALAYHHYCVFVGYGALPFLDRAEFFLAPAFAFALLTPFAMVLGFNPTRFVLWVYFNRS